MKDLLKIVLYGSESTGKTTLAMALAAHYNTVWVPEYAREYLQKKYDRTGEVCAYEDLLPIAKGQLKLEAELAKKARNHLLFCDTNILETYYYGKAYYPDFHHPELWQLIKKHPYDFYFLTYIDIPWEADDLRDRPDQRAEMHQFFEQSLRENQVPYMILKGNKEERLAMAIEKLNELRP